MKTWKKRTDNLTPQFRATDILGALFIAGQMLDGANAKHKVLIVLSDMRHHTPDLDLESRNVVPSFANLGKQAQAIQVAPLRDTEVYVLGVDGAGKTTEFWHSLERFWREYLIKAEALLRKYSVLREVPAIAR